MLASSSYLKLGENIYPHFLVASASPETNTVGWKVKSAFHAADNEELQPVDTGEFWW